MIVAADDTELVRLQPAGDDPRRLGHLGFGPRWLTSGEERIGIWAKRSRGAQPR